MEFTYNAKETDALLVVLHESKLVKEMDCKSAKEIWEKMRNYYEGDNEVKKSKLQGFKIKFESLSLNDDEDIAKYFQRVDEVVNTIRGLDEKLDEDVVIQNVLRSLPERFNPKVSAIEEMENLNTLTLDKLLGILTVYEMH